MKNAIIFGASGGIGSSLVEKIKKNNFNTLEISKNKSPVKCDLSKLSSVNQILEQIVNDFKSIDLLIFAQGISAYNNIEKLSEEELISAYWVNVISVSLIIKRLITMMDKSGSLVLAIGSGAGTIPMKGRSIYCSTKFALRGLFLSLSEEYRGINPKFCHIQLGSTITNFGNMTVQEKEREYKNGKAYFSVEWVSSKLMEIINDENRKDEIILFPSEYGFGEWKKA